MGLYINIGNAGFQSARNGEYVDKSGLISIINATLNTERRFSCITRARRFGKSMAAKMLCAYYDQSCDSRSLFSDLEIASDPSFERHLNKYPVIYIDLSDFMGRFPAEEIVGQMQKRLKRRMLEVYPQAKVNDDDDLMETLVSIVGETRQKFILIIDEWDAICREYPSGTSAMDEYVGWLRRMFKSVSANDVFAAVYMTGILPIKKYKTESALNNFTEYSMLEPRRLAQYFGFTKDEVKSLAAKYGMDFDELEKWYDGYQIGDELSMFNPNSVMQAIDAGRCRSFWASTGAFGAVAHYIQMNFEGLKDDIIRMLAGERVKVNPTKFQNDMTVVRSKDDVLTVLIHLGYLSYNWRRDECYLPNREVASEMVNAVEANNWRPLADAIEQSHQLLEATLQGDADAVARGVEAARDEHTSILSYNNENSLACVLSIAYYYAKNDYVVYRELATGKGFADLVFIPRKNVTTPAIVVELKFNQPVQTAIDQIRLRNYPAKLREYTGEVLLVGISYDRETKQHSCQIDQWEKE